MLPIFAMYVPEPGDLVGRVLVLAIVFTVYCVAAWRMKLNLKIVPIAMLLGACIAVAPDVWAIGTSDLREYGDFCRKWGGSDYSDQFYAITRYFYADGGMVLAAIGMTVPLVLCAVVSTARGRTRLFRRDTSGSPS